jgi:hypothetical protein
MRSYKDVRTVVDQVLGEESVAGTVLYKYFGFALSFVISSLSHNCVQFFYLARF